MKLSVFLSAAVLRSFAEAITLTTHNNSYTVDAGSANSFEVVVSRSTCDITSLKFRGVEAQYSVQGSHIGSGLSSHTTVTAQEITKGSTKYVKITCDTATLTHYYVVRDAQSAVHMATHITAEPSIGELRFIARLKGDVLHTDDVGQASDIGGYSSIVEGADVFVVNGQTRSKFYSSQRFIDDQVHCMSGTDIKACMVIPGNGYESSSGGPFHRDINTNPTGPYSGLYYYMNSGHLQLESYRMGLHGAYSLVFLQSGLPDGKMDLSFMGSLGLKGWVAASGRGTVKGKASGIDGSKYQIVLHWFNDDAQYWSYADSSGNYASPAMKAGTYTQVLYQSELKVASSSVTVTAGGSTKSHIVSTWTKPGLTLFQIGDWDGLPKGFRNADKQARMHPSDARMSAWGPLTYTVGTSAVSDFPMAVFQSVNDPITVHFNLTAAQASGAATLRIGTTLSFSGARPQVETNGKNGTVFPQPIYMNSRGVTRGGYRGRGDIYDFPIASGDLVTGLNTITIGVKSGSSGIASLSPNYIFDAVHLFR
ncbi:probable Probable rhamnogalacturonate lyase A [Rhynchosporium agropyri]|uniref:rhamnogalacturonan endolyase n=1 Tax=Rhynchosporium agropyri TaxID=914238 RepID=A0A1E1KGY7_9HELO|nr:probable Probable rhamnogalacturonate lyase A [Rhynchosporium agropyri]